MATNQHQVQLSMTSPENQQATEHLDSTLFFSTRELSQRIDLIRHLAENSELIPLVKAEAGSGKTTMLYRFLSLAGDNWDLCRIDANPMMHPDQLLTRIGNAFDLEKTYDLTMESVLQHAAWIKSQGRLPIIVVDDAEQLPAATLITLLRLNEQRVDGSPVMSILLFADPSIDGVLELPQLQSMSLQALHELDIPKLRPAQIPRYVQHQLNVEGGGAEFPLETEQVELLFKESRGLPGKINALIHRQMRDASQHQITENSGWKNLLNGMLTVPRLLAGFAVLIVLSGLLFQDEINAIFMGDETISSVEPPRFTKNDSDQAEVGNIADLKGRIEVPLRLPAPVAAVEPKVKLAPLPELAVKPPKPAVLPPVDKPIEKEQVESQAVEITPLEEPSILVEKPKSPAVKRDEPKKTIVNAVTPTPVKTVEKPAEQSQRPAKVKVVVEAKSKSKIPPVKSVVQVKKKPKPVVVVSKPEVIEPPVKKTVVEVKQAAAVTELKSPFQDEAPKPDLKPVVPEVIAIQPPEEPGLAVVEEREINIQPAKKTAMRVIKEVVIPQAKPNVDAQTTAPVVRSSQGKEAVKSVSASKPAKASGTHKEVWLKQQNPKHYSLQILALSSESGLLGYIKKHKLGNKAAYFKSMKNGKALYSLVYGVYPSREAAVAGKSALPTALRKKGGWPRSMASIQQTIGG